MSDSSWPATDPADPVWSVAHAASQSSSWASSTAEKSSPRYWPRPMSHWHPARMKRSGSRRSNRWPPEHL
ncbi:hypothetical protein BJF84_09000 [Rhodococcus sp. CUA-806]|nr:hypothetical protein BJF84_09000 [Rhodococcus sp. CUA-806]